MTFESFEPKVLFECRPTTTRAPAYALQADQRKPRSPSDQAPKTEQTDQKRIVCTFCSKPGHKQANRFAFKRQNVKREKANVADETTSPLLINGNNADFDWVIDSGASSHMVKSLDLLVNPSKLEFPIKVHLADESYLDPYHIGDVHLTIGDTLLT